MLPFFVSANQVILLWLNCELITMSLEKISNKTSNLTCSSGINVVADIDKLVPLFFIDSNNELTIFFTRT